MNVPARESLVSVLGSPAVLGALPGTDGWCLVAGGGPTQDQASTGDGGGLDLQVAGYVVSGSTDGLGEGCDRAGRPPSPGRLRHASLTPAHDEGPPTW